MKIRVRCDKHFTTFDLKLDEVKGWLNIDLLPDESEEEFEKRAQEKVDAEFNRPEYNSLHKYERHKGFTRPYSGEDGEETDDYESCMSDVRDSGIFFKTVNQIKASEEYRAVESFVYSILKPDVADLFMAVRIRKMAINEKAASMLSCDAFETDVDYKKAVDRLANNITQKLKRAEKKLVKNFKKASDFGIRRGYFIGGTNSSNNPKEVM
ncbi:hypothetical protein QP177_05830 [Gardnerella vaginalis]|uniref:Uncharacterized protein n=1 Tax=Gardnerella vaginalis TaxID=2702 RepID=A0ABD4ZDQ3_GARVA|nr:hypothetical protein [Gardnerella vaginalis]MDK6696079.1 hypothetical protein [Gardnerella vaginalis]